MTPLSEDDEVLTAYHEAAHAVMIYLYGGNARSITVIPGFADNEPVSAGNVDGWLSRELVRETPYTSINHYFRVAGQFVAGWIGEEISGKPTNFSGCYDDLESAWYHLFKYLYPDAPNEHYRSHREDSEAWVGFGSKDAQITPIIENEIFPHVRAVLNRPEYNRAVHELAASVLNQKTIYQSEIHETIERNLSDNFHA